MRLRGCVQIALLCLASNIALANGIYSYTDAQGNRVYTDKPPATQPSSLKAAELSPINSITMPVPRAHTERPQHSVAQHEQQDITAYSSVTLLQPEHESTVRANDRVLHVHVLSDPALKPSHSYQLWLDGAPKGAPSQSTSWRVEEIDRGTHSVQVHIVDALGNSIAQSSSHSIHLRQTTLNERRLARPCKKEDYGKRLECPLKDKPPEPRPWYYLGL